MRNISMIAGAAGIALLSAGGGFFKGVLYAENTLVRGGQYVNGILPMPPMPPPVPVSDFPQPSDPGADAHNDALIYCRILEKAGADLEMCEPIGLTAAKIAEEVK